MKISATFAYTFSILALGFYSSCSNPEGQLGTLGLADGGFVVEDVSVVSDDVGGVIDSSVVSGQADAGEPDVSQPDVSLPDVALPDVSLPDVGLPDLGQILTFEEVVSTGRDFDDFPSFRTESEVSVDGTSVEDRVVSDPQGGTVEQRFTCTTRTVSVEDGNGEFPLFSGSSDVIYPGSLLQGATVQDATPAPIVVRRAGGTISYNLNNGNLSSSVDIDEIKRSTVQSAMNQIIARSGSVVPANFQLDIDEVQSEQQLALELGIDIQGLTEKVSASMKFNYDREYNRFLVKLKQVYYTVSFDLPTSLDQIFHPEVEPQQLANYIQEDNPGAFVSSVSYGRIFYMLLESTSSKAEFDVNLNLALGSFANSPSGQLDARALNQLQDIRVQLIAYGGDSQGTFQLLGEDTVDNIARRLAQDTDIRAGLPISYVVRSLERPDQVVGTRLATQFGVRNCVAGGVLPPQALRSFVDLFSDGIGAMVHIADSNIVLFNKAGTQYAWYNGNSGAILGRFSIDDAASPLGVIPLPDVGAAVQRSSDRIFLFDRSGLQVSILNYRDDDSSVTSNLQVPQSPIGTYDVDSEDGDSIFFVSTLFSNSENFPFATRGVEAAVVEDVDQIADLDSIFGTIYESNMFVFGRPGDKYSLFTDDYNILFINQKSWSEQRNTPEWFTQGDTVFFNTVGAATFIQYGPDTSSFLFVNELGNQLIERVGPSANGTISGPWVIR